MCGRRGSTTASIRCPARGATRPARSTPRPRARRSGSCRKLERQVATGRGTQGHDRGHPRRAARRLVRQQEAAPRARDPARLRVVDEAVRAAALDPPRQGERPRPRRPLRGARPAGEGDVDHPQGAPHDLAALAQAVRHELLDRNVALNAEPPAVRGKQTRPPTIEELTQLLDAADDDFRTFLFVAIDDRRAARRARRAAVARRRPRGEDDHDPPIGRGGSRLDPHQGHEVAPGACRGARRRDGGDARLRTGSGSRSWRRECGSELTEDRFVFSPRPGNDTCYVPKVLSRRFAASLRTDEDQGSATARPPPLRREPARRRRRRHPHRVGPPRPLPSVDHARHLHPPCAGQRPRRRGGPGQAHQAQDDRRWSRLASGLTRRGRVRTRRGVGRARR